MDDNGARVMQTNTIEDRELREELMKLDPAPSLTDVAADQLVKLTNNLTQQGLVELRRLRDEADALMIGLRKRDESLIAQITDHRDNVARVLESKEVMAEHLAKLKELFAPVTPVITNGRGE